MRIIMGENAIYAVLFGVVTLFFAFGMWLGHGAMKDMKAMKDKTKDK
jgi:hypothetical protein